MKKFVDRKNEINFLQNEYKKKESSFVVIYGRRRIGKTSLLSEFIKDKDALFFLATEESENENRNAFTKSVAMYTQNELLENAKVDEWETLFYYLASFMPEKRKLIIIDEFQYIGKSNPAFISKMQKFLLPS